MAAPAQAIADISAGRAAVAVLPLPSETEAPRGRLVDGAAAEGRAAHPRGRPAAVLGAAARGRPGGAGSRGRGDRAGPQRARPLAAGAGTGAAT